jgi:4-amino-4-deoxy-L-arabinose transferase-like glycosyltransferase
MAAKTQSQLVANQVDIRWLIQHSSVIQALLISAIIVAAVLRVYKLGEWSFWGDEYITVGRASSLFDTGSNLPPASLFLTHVSIALGGTSEWTARLPAAVIGVLTIPALFYLVKKTFDPAVALVASLLLAISPWHLYWSQNARFYTALLLFYTLSLFFLYLGIEKDRPRYLVLSLAFLVLALQERLVAAFLVPTFIGYVLLLKFLPFEKPAGLRTRNLLLLFGPGILGLIYFISGNSAIQVGWFNRFGLVNSNPLWILAGVVFYVGLPTLVVAAAGAWYLLSVKSRAALLLTLAATIPLIAIMGLSLFQYTANRYVFVSLTSIIVLAAAATRELLWQTPKTIKFVAAGYVLILFLAPMADNFLYFQYQNGNRDNWKDAFALLSTLKADGDPVVTINRPLADYYMREATVSMLHLDLADYVADKRRVWFVVDLTTPVKAPQAYHWILTNTQIVDERDVTVGARTFPMRIHLYDSEYHPAYNANPASTVTPP